MPTLTPQDLATASTCLMCLEGSIASQIFVYLLAVWATDSATPQQLEKNAVRFQQFVDSEAAAAATYLLSVINGGTQDPNTLSLDSTCFYCLDNIQPRVQLYLLATITGQPTDPNALLAASNAFQAVPNLTPIILYLLARKAGNLSADAVAAAVPCWRCLPEQPRIQTYLLADIAS